jgi:hypothetical protein
LGSAAGCDGRRFASTPENRIGLGVPVLFRVFLGTNNGSKRGDRGVSSIKLTFAGHFWADPHDFVLVF